MAHGTCACGDLHASKIDCEYRINFYRMVRSKCHSAVSIGDPNRYHIASKSKILQQRRIEHSLVLINKLIITVNVTDSIHQIDAVVGQIKSIGQFNANQSKLELNIE